MAVQPLHWGLVPKMSGICDMGLAPYKPRPRFSMWLSKKRDRYCQQDTSPGSCVHRCTQPVCMAWGYGPRGAHGAAPHHTHVLGLRWAMGLALSSPPALTGAWPTGQVAARTLAEISLPSPSPGGTRPALGQGLGASGQQACFLVGL